MGRNLFFNKESREGHSKVGL